MPTCHVFRIPLSDQLVFQIIDLLVRLLKYSPEMLEDADNLIQVFKAAYEVLHTYMIGNSRKNALYFAKYIDFFQTQFNVKVLLNSCFTLLLLFGSKLLEIEPKKTEHKICIHMFYKRSEYVVDFCRAT